MADTRGDTEIRTAADENGDALMYATKDAAVAANKKLLENGVDVQALALEAGI